MFFDHEEFSILDMIAISEDKLLHEEGSLNSEFAETEIAEVDLQVLYEIAEEDASQEDDV